MEHVDEDTRLAGILQLTSGLVNLLVMTAVWVLGAGGIGGIASMIVGSLCACPVPFGIVCGAVGIFPLLLGFVELISGLLVLTGQPSRRLIHVTAVLEVLSLAWGGVISAAVGLVIVGKQALDVPRIPDGDEPTRPRG